MVLPASMDATWLDGAVQFNGQELRRADSALWTGTGAALGVQGGIVRHADNSLAVTVSVADVVTVQPGAVVIPGNAGTANGVYRTALPVAETGNLTARNATNPRIDRVIYRVLDTSVVGSHGAYTGRVEILTGVAGVSPALPALPTLAVELARINVPASGGGAATVDSTWREYAAAIGGILPVATKDRLPATPNAKWLKAIAIDTGVDYYWNGTAWTPKDVAIAGTFNAQALPAGGAWTRLQNWTGFQYLPAAAAGLTNLGTGRFRIDIAGWYVITCSVQIQGGGGGSLRALRILIESGAVTVVEDRSVNMAGASPTAMLVQWEGRLALNTILNFDAYHDHGGPLNAQAVGTAMSIRRVAD